jgi:hypothetical protein
MKKLCAVLALMSALGVGPGMAHAPPAKKWPVFDGARLQQIIDAFAAKGVTVCPAQVHSPQDITAALLSKQSTCMPALV